MNDDSSQRDRDAVECVVEKNAREDGWDDTINQIVAEVGHSENTDKDTFLLLLFLASG